MRVQGYHEAGYFLKKHPTTTTYAFANWGSRRWEYCFVADTLKRHDILSKTVVDIGIGLPSDSDFYTYYVASGCTLVGFDPDERLDEVTVLSDSCRILRQSADDTGLESSTVDVVVALSSLEHFPYDVFVNTIREVHRILKDEGIFVVTLDMTIDKYNSARWAILEKTINKLPVEENDERLSPEHVQISLEYFIELVSDSFSLQDGSHPISSPRWPLSKYVHNHQWNSIVGYAVFNKKKVDTLGVCREIASARSLPAD